MKTIVKIPVLVGKAILVALCCVWIALLWILAIPCQLLTGRFIHEFDFAMYPYEWIETLAKKKPTQQQWELQPVDPKEVLDKQRTYNRKYVFFRDGRRACRRIVVK